MVYTVYCLTNAVNGKQYVGQTNSLKRRLREHRRATSHCRALNSAIKKYGWLSFNVRVLARALSADTANLLETQYIEELDTLAPAGYNLMGGGCDRTVMSAETLERRREAGRTSGMKGKKHTPETKLLLSIALKGRDVSGGAERLKRYWAKPENRARRAAQWTPERRKKQGDRMRKRRKDWQADPANKVKHTAARWTSEKRKKQGDLMRERMKRKWA